MWSSRGGADVTVSILLKQIQASPVEGVTLLGGEPFEQAAALASLAASVQAAGLSVMTFTGLTIEQIRASRDLDVQRLLQHTDLLVDGKYEEDKLDLTRPWVGSTNQRFHFTSSRYADLQPHLHAADKLEVRVAVDGTLQVNGWARQEDLDALLQNLGRRQRNAAAAASSTDPNGDRANVPGTFDESGRRLLN